MALILLLFLFVVLLVISLIAGANRRVLFEAISGWVIVLTLIWYYCRHRQAEGLR